jgi:hypothetical protein
LTDQIQRKVAQALIVGGPKAVDDLDIPALGPPELLQPLLKSLDARFRLRIIFAVGEQDPDMAHPIGWLRSPGAWGKHRHEGRASRQGHEIAPPHKLLQVPHMVRAASASQHRRRHGEAERLGGLQIYCRIEFDWLLDRQVCSLRALPV